MTPVYGAEFQKEASWHGPDTVALKVCWNEPFENFWKLLINHPAEEELLLKDPSKELLEKDPEEELLLKDPEEELLLLETSNGSF